MMPNACQRCGKERTALIMSRFNTEMICLSCERKEKQHPAYKEAARVELEAVKSGNLNFEGMGKPADL